MVLAQCVRRGGSHEAKGETILNKELLARCKSGCAAVSVARFPASLRALPFPARASLQTRHMHLVQQHAQASTCYDAAVMFFVN